MEIAPLSTEISVTRNRR